MNPFQPYRLLRSDVELKCSDLHQLHKAETQCRKGCSQCCMNFNLTPVEFNSIKDELKDKLVQINHEATEDECIFLIDHSCSIYEHRPLICRSHGLPIANMNDETDEMELSFCPLNFNEVDDDYFTMENVYEQDRFNSKLFLANHHFVSENKMSELESNTLISMNRLKEFIGKE